MTQPKTLRYLTYSELIFINGKILDDPAIISGKQKVRDIDLLMAAEARPQASAFGQDAFPTLRQKAAALLHAIARNHPFKDGNKRTATVATLFMLAVNGQRVIWDATDALNVIVDIAEGRRDLDFLSDWLQLEQTDHLPEPDLSRDTALIEQLIVDNRWLLNELATR